MRARLNSVGFTTVELMVALVLAGIVTAAISAVLRRQQRFYTNAASLVEQRVALRDITGILPGELRALSPAGGDVLAFSDSALDLRATIGTAIACDTVAFGGDRARTGVRSSCSTLVVHHGATGRRCRPRLRCRRKRPARRRRLDPARRRGRRLESGGVRRVTIRIECGCLHTPHGRSLRRRQSSSANGTAGRLRSAASTGAVPLLPRSYRRLVSRIL